MLGLRPTQTVVVGEQGASLAASRRTAEAADDVVGQNCLLRYERNAVVGGKRSPSSVTDGIGPKEG